MHLGNARTALLAWLQVRAAGGRIVMRVEDLDAQRVVAGAEARILDDLRWLGIDWDEGPDVGGPHAPYRQSERAARYESAVRTLLDRGRAFECACSRAEIARAASAPNAGDEGPRYPGTCRDLAPGEAAARARAAGREPAVRFRGNGERVRVHDLVRGEVDPLGDDGVDDFVIRRVDGVAAYQLAVVADDAAMEITHVLRADDLLASTPRQIALARALDLPTPEYAHVALVLAPGGERLAKRNRPAAIADLRAAGVAPEAVVGALAASAGLVESGVRVRPRELVDGFSLAKLRREAVEMDGAVLITADGGGARTGDAIVTRAAEAGDVIPLAEVYVASWQAAYRGIVPDGVLDALTVRTQAARWQKMLAGMSKGLQRAWVVEEDGRLRGFVVTGPLRGDTTATAPVGEVWAMYLDPAAWRRGLGRRLLAHAESDLRGRGFGEVLLWVLTKNDRGRRFYEGVGYAPTGETRASRLGDAWCEEIRYQKRLA